MPESGVSARDYLLCYLAARTRRFLRRLGRSRLPATIGPLSGRRTAIMPVMDELVLWLVRRRSVPASARCEGRGLGALDDCLACAPCSTVPGVWLPAPGDEMRSRLRGELPAEPETCADPGGAVAEPRASSARILRARRAWLPAQAAIGCLLIAHIPPPLRVQCARRVAGKPRAAPFPASARLNRRLDLRRAVPTERSQGSTTSVHGCTKCRNATEAMRRGRANQNDASGTHHSPERPRLSSISLRISSHLIPSPSAGWRAPCGDAV